jgi:predicted GNAT superfamily acetyltransferase
MQIQQSKSMIHKSSQKLVRVSFEVLSADDIQAILTLENLVMAKLKDQTYYYSGGEHYYQKIFFDYGTFLGVKTNFAQLIAFSALITTYEKEILEYARLVDLNKRPWTEICILDTVVVAPEFRGNGIQRELVQQLMELAKIKHSKKYMLCTVHPENTFSLNNFIKLGFEIKSSKIIYGGLSRYILLKNLD